MYMQSQGQYNNQPKKKKKHRLLKFIIIATLIIAVKKTANILSEQELQSFATQYPFEFSNEQDSLYYITDKFKVPTQYNTNDKTYNVKWKSSKSNISIDENGNATVTRPSDTDKTAKLTEIYRGFIIGKAERTYELTVIPTSTLSIDDIDVVTRDELENKTYNKEMTAYLDDNGNIESMYGDFGKTIINSKEDAYTVVKAYKSTLGLPENLEFKLSNYNISSEFGVYTFNIVINNTEISNETIQLTTNTNQLVKITNNINLADLGDLGDTANLELDNYNEIIEAYLISKGIDSEYLIASETTEYYSNKLCKTYGIHVENFGNYIIYIDLETKEVIDFKSDNKDYEKTKVVCHGVTEEGKKISFDASKGGFLTEKYSLLDTGRNLTAVDNKAFWLCQKTARHAHDDNKLVSVASTIGTILLLGENYIAPNVNLDITSDTTEFDNSIAIQAYKNMQDSYDWYVKTFDRYSYDNNGAEIKILIDSDSTKDNASWVGMSKIFMINPTVNFKYSLGKDLEVLGHEYAHAVFSTYLSGSGGEEIDGINEAYADVFGCLISGKDKWIIGHNYRTDYNDKEMAIRDLVNYNSDLTNYSGEIYFPEKYKDENWTGECHNISVLISHIGYEMHASKLFSDKDVADIWYKSLTFGLNSDTKFLDVRRNLIQAADQLGYSKEHQDFIARQFDLEEIYDKNYKITTANETDGTDGKSTEYTEDGTLKTESKAVEGDWMLDDTGSNTYLIVTSPMGLVMKGEPLLIFESGSKISKAEKKLRSEQLTEIANNKNSVLKQIVLDENTKIKVEYYRVSPAAMKLLKRICEDSDKYVVVTAAKAIGEAELSEDDKTAILDIMKSVSKLGFYWFVTDSTPYKLYDNLGFIDYSN